MPVKSSAAIMTVTEVSFAFEGNVILDQISFELKAGDYLGIIGPNGGGKTTLLKLMLGLLKPQTGEVQLLNEPIQHSRDRHLLGYVPQRGSLQEYLFPATVDEVVMSGRTATRGWLSMRSTLDVAAVKRAMKVADISYLARRRVGTLSGGERQRVMIARALAGEPKILMLDEPTTFVDAPSQETFYHFLRKLHDQGLTIVIVSHDIDTITHEVDTVLCLNKHLVCHGPAEEIMRRVGMETMYGQRPVIHHHH